jgi:hypothetical protein
MKKSFLLGIFYFSIILGSLLTGYFLEQGMANELEISKKTLLLTMIAFSISMATITAILFELIENFTTQKILNWVVSSIIPMVVLIELVFGIVSDGNFKHSHLLWSSFMILSLTIGVALVAYLLFVAIEKIKLQK